MTYRKDAKPSKEGYTLQEDAQASKDFSLLLNIISTFILQ